MKWCLFPSTSFCHQGFLVPICGFCIVKLSLEDNPEDREDWCTVLIVLRHILEVLFWNTFLAGLVFRFLIIRYADRGLVVKGNPNLILFNQLYWIFLGAFSCIGLFWPFTYIFQGKLDNVNSYKICVLLPLEDINRQNLFIILSHHGLGFFFTQWLTYRKDRYLAGFFPLKKMSGIGKFKRNLISYDKNRICLYLYLSQVLLHIFIVNVAKTYPTIVPPVFYFWCQNLAAFLPIIFLHVLIVPTTLTQGGASQCRVKTFYVRKPVLEPRRDYTLSQLTNINISTVHQPPASCSHLMRRPKNISMPAIDI